jgi:hypothetical protein
MFGFLNQNTKHHPKVMLTDADIKRLKKNHGVVLFFMNGCGHCVDMKDEWNAAVDECRNTGFGHENDDFVLGAIESGNTNLFKENGISHNVSGYPTILYISSEGIQRGDANHEKYEKPRKKAEFVEWIKDKKNKKNKNKGKTSEDKIDVTNKNALKTNNIIGKQIGGGKRRSYRRKSKYKSKYKSKSKSKRHMKRHTRHNKRTRRHHRRHMKGGGCGCNTGVLL